MKLSKFFFLLFLVFLSLFIYKIYLRTVPRNITLYSNKENTSINQTDNLKPVGIAISSIKVWLPLIPTKIVNNSWVTVNTGVSYWVDGVVPGKRGNAVLYGHNWGNLLGNLSHVKPGDQITIYYADNTKKTFVVNFTQEVDANNASILKNTSDTRLTLYTCSGFLDSKRFVVVANFI